MGALLKVHPIPHAIFETTRSGFIQILHHYSVSWKITPLYFFSSNLIYLGQKLLDFWVVGWKFTKFLMPYLKPQVSFSLNSASLFNVMRDSLLYFFSWNFIWFLQKEPTTEQNVSLLTAQVKFYQICTLIGYLCWKYVKFQPKKVWRKYVSWYQRVVQNLKKNLFFVSKMTRIWWILVRAIKSLTNLHFNWCLLCKIYNLWP